MSVIGSRFEERLTDIARAELIQLLKVKADRMLRAEEIRLQEERELEEAIQVELQVESRKLMGGWA